MERSKLEEGVAEQGWGQGKPRRGGGSPVYVALLRARVFPDPRAPGPSAEQPQTVRGP